jgi:hypothetical protein
MRRCHCLARCPGASDGACHPVPVPRLQLKVTCACASAIAWLTVPVPRLLPGDGGGLYDRLGGGLDLRLDRTRAPAGARGRKGEKAGREMHPRQHAPGRTRARPGREVRPARPRELLRGGRTAHRPDWRQLARAGGSLEDDVANPVDAAHARDAHGRLQVVAAREAHVPAVKARGRSLGSLPDSAAAFAAVAAARAALAPSTYDAVLSALVIQPWQCAQRSSCTSSQLPTWPSPTLPMAEPARRPQRASPAPAPPGRRPPEASGRRSPGRARPPPAE